MNSILIIRFPKHFVVGLSIRKILNIFKILIDEPDLEWVFIDGSHVRAHQHSSGAPGLENQAISKSAGGNSTKIHLAIDSYGNPIEFISMGLSLAQIIMNVQHTLIYYPLVYIIPELCYFLTYHLADY